MKIHDHNHTCLDLALLAPEYRINMEQLTAEANPSLSELSFAASAGRHDRREASLNVRAVKKFEARQEHERWHIREKYVLDL